MSAAFDNLSQLQTLCQEKAVGLPTKVKVEDDWVGIGFSTNAVNCIARMTEVTEILPVPETIRVPGVKSWVKGLANIRGALMPILDLKGYLIGGDTVLNKKSRILVVNKSGVLAGIVVEEVFGLRRFKEGTQKSSKSKVEEIHSMNMDDYITGEFNENSEHWNIFSMSSLVTTEKFLRVV